MAASTKWLTALWHTDWFLVTADFQSYSHPRTVDVDYRDQARWTERSILNTTKVGFVLRPHHPRLLEGRLGRRAEIF